MTLYYLDIRNPDGTLHPSCDETLWNTKWFATHEEAEAEFRGMVEEFLVKPGSTFSVLSREFPVTDHNPLNGGVAVVLNEEHGIATWIWDSGLTKDQLKTYWSTLNSVDHLYLDLKRLPGTITRVMPTRSRGLVLSKSGGSVIRCGEQSWEAHIWRDRDSWVRDDSGVMIYHRGFHEV